MTRGRTASIVMSSIGKNERLVKMTLRESASLRTFQTESSISGSISLVATIAFDPSFPENRRYNIKGVIGLHLQILQVSPVPEFLCRQVKETM